jgi:hypothetical protein
MYRSRNKGSKGFALMHCYTKLKRCEKWRQTHLQLAKRVGNVIDLDVPQAASAGRPIDNKKAKAAVLEAASSDKLASSIDKYISDVSSNLTTRAEKSDQRWKSILLKQDEKIELEKEKVVVKKRKEDFKILTADTSNMDDEVKAAHMYTAI